MSKSLQYIKNPLLQLEQVQSNLQIQENVQIHPHPHFTQLTTTARPGDKRKLETDKKKVNILDSTTLH